MKNKLINTTPSIPARTFNHERRKRALFIRRIAEFLLKRFRINTSISDHDHFRFKVHIKPLKNH